ncbi:Na+-driven multidrug efflux pump [Candidatus Paraburkholderia kirkii UZHbot1]|uniref:Multidrug-efflux transporter n=1 Tax=Candidatus Paraburkholderia kirkii UZHbot1 TaxID=1055526 RepID=G4M3W3_9BURK|nr:Na+-driven multidrug efflux pump [Candidatus Paraburkholderia kirkii UZHbot1]
MIIDKKSTIDSCQSQLQRTVFSRAAVAEPSLPCHAADTARLAVPLAIAQLSQVGMSITDALLLGSLGSSALAAGGLGANLFFTVVSLLQGVLTSVSVSVSHARGAKDEQRVLDIYWTGFLLSLLLSISAFVLLSFANPILLAVGTPTLLVQDIVNYTDVLRWATAGSLIATGLMRSFLPAIGAAKWLLWVALGGGFINGFLSYGLIHGMCGLPRMGFLGPATATTFTVWLSALTLITLLHMRRHFRHFAVLALPSMTIMRELLEIGWPVAIICGVETMLFLAVGMVVGILGTSSLASNQIAISIASVGLVVPVAIGQAANVRISFFSGAGYPLAARRAGFAAFVLGLCFMTLSALVLVLARDRIVGFYLPGDSHNSETVDLATSLLVVTALFLIVDGMQMIASGCLRGLKDTLVPMIIAAFGYWGIAFPIGYTLALPFDFGVRGLWWGLAIGLTTVALLMTLRFHVLSLRTSINQWNRPVN